MPRRVGLPPLRLAHKLPLLVISLALAAAAATGFVAERKAAQALTAAAEAKLSALLEARWAALADYLGSIEEDVRFQATNPTVLAALEAFREGWRRLGADPVPALHRLYIHDNPHPTGEKDELDRAADASDYTKAHARFHPWFRTFLRERGYYDLFLFDPEGNCIYTVFKELDYATNLITGPWRDTDLGRVFRAARANARPGFLAFADFAPYKPSHGAPAGFIATPVLGPGTRLMGVLALQMPIGRLNAVMRPTAGMGATGDTYIVGADQLMRSQARFAERSSILRTTADTEPVRAALAGRSGVRATTGYRGAPVMSAYAPLDFHGTRWAILADVGLDETLAPVREMRADMLVAVLAVGSAVTLAGFLFARTLTGPLAAMTAAMRRLADGDLAVEVPPAGGDEIGTMARTLVLAREVLAARNQAEIALREQTAIVELLQAIAVAANEAVAVDEAMRFCLDRVCAHTGWPIGHVYALAEDGTDELLPTSVWHLEDPERFATFRAVTETMHFASGVGLPGRVLASGRPSWIIDVTKDPNFPRATGATDIGIKASFGFPVLIGHEVVAVLEFFASEALEPDEPLLDVMAHIGTQLGRVVERKRAEIALRHAKEEAEEASRAKSRFLASMSHELRTPLNAIIGYSEMLYEEAEVGGLDTFLPDLVKIREAGSHLLSLINDILDLSKIEAGKMDVLIEEFEVADLIAQVQSVIEPLMTKNANTLVVECAPDAGAMRSDQTKLRQSLFNLLSNAAKFTERGRITACGPADRPGR